MAVADRGECLGRAAGVQQRAKRGVTGLGDEAQRDPREALPVSRAHDAGLGQQAGWPLDRDPFLGFTVHHLRLPTVAHQGCPALATGGCCGLTAGPGRPVEADSRIVGPGWFNRRRTPPAGPRLSWSQWPPAWPASRPRRAKRSRAVMMAGSGPAAARQGGADGSGDILERGDRAVGKGQPDGRDAAGGEHEEFQAVTVQAAGDDPVGLRHAVSADASDELGHVPLLEVAQHAGGLAPQRVRRCGAVLVERDLDGRGAGELDRAHGDRVGGYPGGVVVCGLARPAR